MSRRQSFGRSHHVALLVAARIAFTAASLVVAYGVFAPPSRGGVSIMPWDKAEHFTAFFGLMGLALVAFPGTALWVLAAWLSFAGAMIEVIQATPLVNRDADVWDWVADTVGILAIAGTVIAARLRRSLADHWGG